MGAESVIADLPEAVVRRISVSPMDNNVYLVTAKESGAQVLIDPADDADAILALIDEAHDDAAQPTHVDAIVTTHAHHDHIQALAALADRTGATTLAGAADAHQIEVATGVPIARRLNNGDQVEVPGLSLEVIGLRGHTAGSISLALDGFGHPVHLFTGDALFPGGVGDTQHDPARFNQLFSDVSHRLFDRFPDSAVVHPGHGQPTTLGAERPHLRQWQARGW